MRLRGIKKSGAVALMLASVLSVSPVVGAKAIEVEKKEVFRVGKTVITVEEEELFKASWEGDYEAIEAFLTQHPEFLSQNIDRKSFYLVHAIGDLSRARSYRVMDNIIVRCLDIVNLFLSQPGGDLNCAPCGATPLHRAVETQQSDIVRLLVSQPNIDLNVKDDNGETPLHIAARKGYTEIVSLLISLQGIDLKLTINEGETALDLAKKHNHQDIVRPLEEAIEN